MEEVMWNPWHGCHKCSEGCLRCYMYERDEAMGIDSNIVKQTRTGFRLPVQRSRVKNSTLEKYELQYKIPSGSHVMTCMTSDFFIEEADIWRRDAWEFIHERRDCLFEIITKRPERIKQCVPANWLDGWNNVIINVTVENENRAWERIPLLLDADVKHRGIVIEPMLEDIDISPFLSSGFIEKVTVGGESYKGYKGLARPLHISWVKHIKEQCEEYEVPFYFHQTGTRLQQENGRIIVVHRKDDEKGLAKFYDFNIEDIGGINWRQTAAELEMQSLAEDANSIYRKILKDNEKDDKYVQLSIFDFIKT